MQLEPIGTIFSPYEELEGMPVQPRGAHGVKGTVELKPDLEKGLQDLEGFSHIILVYWFHLSRGYSLKVKPFMDDVERGLFATRAPRRPNPIGLSVVRLNRVKGNLLYIENVDIVSGTPLLDIKPYVPIFDNVEDLKLGWLEGKAQKSEEIKADERFKQQ